MTVDPQVWGDAATWTASILTGCSLLLGFSIMRRDRRQLEADTAAGVAVWLEWHGMLGTDFETDPQVDTQYGQWVYVVEARNESSKAIRRPRVQVLQNEGDALSLYGRLSTKLHSPLSVRSLLTFRAETSFMALAPIEPLRHDTATADGVTTEESSEPLEFGLPIPALMPPGAHWRAIIPEGMGESTVAVDGLLLHFSDPRGRLWVRDVQSGALSRVEEVRRLRLDHSRRVKIAVTRTKRIKRWRD